MPIISAPQLLVEGRLAGPGTIAVHDGIIVDVTLGTYLEGPGVTTLSDGVVSAGLVDVQVNGAFGVDLVIATLDEWQTVACALPATGVTAFQPTFITAPLDEQIAGCARAADAVPQLGQLGGAARVLGIHLEGPFLSPRQAGVHDASLMQPPTPAAIDTLLHAEPVRQMVTMVTLAPELPGALDAISRFTAAGIRVSIGHSDARAHEVVAAVDAGATMVTHIFNAQRGLGHREPGVAGQALAEPRLTVGLIADFVHVVPQICSVIFNAARDRVALVTDSMAAAGMPPGVYELGGQQIEVREGDVVPHRADGTIAGSSLRLDRAVRNLIGAGLDPAIVLEAATRVPADVLGRRDLGRIAPGARADLVWWSDEWRPQQVWIDGEVVHATGDVPSPRRLEVAG